MLGKETCHAINGCTTNKTLLSFGHALNSNKTQLLGDDVYHALMCLKCYKRKETVLIKYKKHK